MATEIRSGTLIAEFRVERAIGAGAMGTVFLAEDVRTGARVALKVLAPELARDGRFRERFLRESRIAADLDHPNITRTFASGEHDGLPYLAMAYVDGPDLRELLRRDGRFAPVRAVALVAQVARALDAAHRAWLVRRDLKPGNILVAPDTDGEHAYVCDFGLARHVSSVSSLTGERGFVGTIGYVPPEQIEGGKIDARADVYSLGCVLFELLAGERPFERDSELSVVFAHLNDPPPRVGAAAGPSRCLRRRLRDRPREVTGRAVLQLRPARGRRRRSRAARNDLPVSPPATACARVDSWGRARGRGRGRRRDLATHKGGTSLRDADGKPILGAGSIDTVVTFDNATGDLISFQETVHGPHPVRDGVDVCTPSIAYLTSP